MYIKNKSLATPLKPQGLNPQEFIVIDLRSHGYFLISHIKDALNIESFNRIHFIAQENKDKKILLYCHSGATAAEFGTKLVEQGHQNIYYLDSNYFELEKNKVPMEHSS
ncbi:hypothetical protein B6S12_03500 [Helicobacter valdiviensis]|uniref:Rhodanese domain-containing protein n=1 Tax=Helicobacter valdiviensis TaxID=1458358 RepID=A0A2W6MVL4_9HELI|nr:rhodanese-like domain-containing protein [Helicobacter valdiviensis]PZT48545.1 hypothetical protein B6S12_03500 [Helicobacter valdiviensis]